MFFVLSYQFDFSFFCLLYLKRRTVVQRQAVVFDFCNAFILCGLIYILNQDVKSIFFFVANGKLAFFGLSVQDDSACVLSAQVGLCPRPIVIVANKEYGENCYNHRNSQK